MNTRAVRLSILYIVGTVVMFAAALLFLAPLPAAVSPIFSGDGFMHNITNVFAMPRIKHAITFTILQAFCSMLVAVAVGIPAAFFTARRTFPGRRLLLSLSAVPLCTPPLLIALAFVLFYGRNGVLNRVVMSVCNLDTPPAVFLYSFFGVVITQGLYNFPLVMRITGDAWSRQPEEPVIMARLLGANEQRIFRTITFPYLIPSIGAAALPVFLSCFFSFIIVLLFSGIGSTTLEVELFQSVRGSLDYVSAGGIALIETGVAICIIGCYAMIERHFTRRAAATEEKCIRQFVSGRERLPFFVFAVCLLLFFFGPLLTLLARSFISGQGDWSVGNYVTLFNSVAFRRALVNTCITGIQSATLATISGLFFALWSVKKSDTTGEQNSRQWIQLLAMMPLAVSGIVSGFGWMQIAGNGSVAVLVCAQAAASCPYVMRTVRQQLLKLRPEWRDAAQTLGAGNAEFSVTVAMQLCKKSIMSGFCFAFAVSAGDASLPLVLGIPGYENIALMLFRYAGARRTNVACACGVILAIITAALFFIQDKTDET